jgi:hypothetical protein
MLSHRMSQGCDGLQAYSTAASNNLDGSLDSFGYGASSAACCTAQYACPFANVISYSCTTGGFTYEIVCCSKDPSNGDFSSCGATTYSAAVAGPTSTGTTASECTATGLEKVVACSARPAGEGYATVQGSPGMHPLPDTHLSSTSPPVLQGSVVADATATPALRGNDGLPAGVGLTVINKPVVVPTQGPTAGAAPVSTGKIRTDTHCYA